MTPTGRDIGRIADCPSSIYYGLTLVEYKHRIIMWLNPEYRDIEVEYELKDLPHPEGRPRALHSELLLITEVIKTNYYDNTWSHLIFMDVMCCDVGRMARLHVRA